MLETLDSRWEQALQRKAQAYAHDAFDVALDLEAVSPASLPFYLLDRYSLWRGELLGRTCIFMAPRPGVSQEGMVELARHRTTVSSQLHTDLVVLLFDSLLPRQRRTLIAGRVAFMVPGAQLFVPELLLELRDGRRAKPPMSGAPARLSPTAQMVTIAALLRRETEGANATTLARRFGVAVMSVVRAFDELQAVGVADARRVGRERMLHMQAEGRELWRKVEGLLQSPVRKVRRVIIPHPDRFPGLIAGESALASYTPLASPRHQTLAVAGADWNRLVREHGLREGPDYGEGDDLETWTYDPAVFAQRMVVDRLSLYLSIRRHADERVAQAAEQLLESLPW